MRKHFLIILLTTSFCVMLLSACSDDSKEPTSSESVPVIENTMPENTPHVDTPNQTEQASFNDDIMRIFLNKTMESGRLAAAQIGDPDLPYPNIDPFDYYYDGAESIDMVSRLLLQRGYIDTDEYNELQTYRANAVNKFIAIIDGTEGDLLNLGNETHLTGVMNYYLDQKALGNTLPGIKQALIDAAQSGTNWSYMDEGTYTYETASASQLNMREVGLALRTFIEAMTVMREDGDAIPAEFESRVDNSLAFSKSHVEQLLTGITLEDKAYNVFTQAFYNGMTAMALITADEYFLKYEGARDPEILPLVKKLADWMLLGGGVYYRYDISSATAGDLIEYQQIVNGQSRGAQQFVINADDIGRGYIELSAPITGDPANATIQLLNNSSYPELFREEWTWLQKDLRGTWAFWYADRQTSDVTLHRSTSAAHSLSNLVNPMFAWLDYMGESYGQNKSYEQAYWNTFTSSVLYGDGWYLGGTSIGKRFNQIYRDMRYAFEWLNVDVSTVPELTMQSLSGSMIDGNQLSDHGWLAEQDDTLIQDDAIRFTSDWYANVLRLNDPDVKALQVEMTLGESTLSSQLDLMAGLTANANQGYRVGEGRNSINFSFDGGSSSLGIGKIYALTEGETYRFRVEVVDMNSVNIDANDTELVVITVFDTEGDVVSTVHHTQAPALTPGSYGIRLYADGQAEMVNLPLSSIMVAK